MADLELGFLKTGVGEIMGFAHEFNFHMVLSIILVCVLGWIVLASIYG